MTKRTFDIVTKALRQSKPRSLDARIHNAGVKSAAALDAWRTCVNNVGIAFADDNIRFSRAVFHEACGYSENS